MQAIKAIRGMNDILPEDMPTWQYLESVCRDILARYGYQEIRFPILEQTSLFKRSVGEATDIVEKEMYTFEDRNGDSLSLRPEGTAGCVRAGIEHGLFYNQTQRLWYYGPMYRHERPQRGRYRQFFQIGVENIGMAGPGIDAELIIMTARLWKALGIDDVLRLELNTLGDGESRAAHRKALVEYFTEHQSDLDEGSSRRLESNPLRILDSKNPAMQALIENAPKILDYLDEASIAHFNRIKQLLDAAGVKYNINPRLVRGLDYYGLTVFEWVTDSLGAQGTICAGGRYDALVELLGGKPTPAVGFAMGLERIVEILKDKDTRTQSPDVYFVVMGEAAEASALKLAETLRDDCPNVKIETHLNGGSFKSQFKRADKSGAKVACIMGEEEAAKNQVTLKFLREKIDQVTIKQDDCKNELIKYFNKES